MVMWRILSIWGSCYLAWSLISDIRFSNLENNFYGYTLSFFISLGVYFILTKKAKL